MIKLSGDRWVEVYTWEDVKKRIDRLEAGAHGSTYAIEKCHTRDQSYYTPVRVGIWPFRKTLYRKNYGGGGRTAWRITEGAA